MSGNGPIVQWSFLQYKKLNKKTAAPAACVSQSFTQIGSKLLAYGGCNYNGEPLSQLFLYDTQSYEWSEPGDAAEFQESHPGNRYGHTATVIDMHPPKVMIYGGMVGGGTYEFDAPDGMGMPDSADSSASSAAGESASALVGSSSGPSSPAAPSSFARSFPRFGSKNKRKGKVNKQMEECDFDHAVYLLELNKDRWAWSKPLILGPRVSQPQPRTDHSACKSGTNEVSVFGGWVSGSGPTNELWAFNTADSEWRNVVTSGIQPRARYRHTSEMIGSRMYVLGGSENGEDVAEGARHLSLHELNCETMQWAHPFLSGISPFPRSGHGSAVIGAQTVVVFGGKRSAEQFLNDLCLIDTSSFTVTTVNAVEAYLPTPVANVSVCAVGNRCFVFGGTDKDGECYNDIRSIDVGEYLDSHDITVGEGSSSDYSFKILIIGDSGVGKSALLTRFSDNVFIPTFTSTIGIDFNSRMIRVDKAVCKLEIWDTAGQERFSTITANYYRGAQGALLVYDVDSKSSFEHVRQWYDRAKMLGGSDLECLLVGNKIDLANRQVSFEEGSELAQELGVSFIETSALSGSNVEQAFVTMTAAIKASVDRRNLTGIKDDNLKAAGGVSLATGERKMSALQKCGCN